MKSDPSLNIRAPDVASPNIPNAPLEEDIPIQAVQDRKRTADQRVQELEVLLEKEREALKNERSALEKERKDKDEMKRVIKMGLRFI